MEQIFDKIPKSSVEYVRCLISSENIIFKLKKSQIDIKKLFSKIKSEVVYKKFNFLIY